MHWHGHIHAQNVFIIGATGGVGGKVIEQINRCDFWDSDHLHPTRILGVANSKKILLADPNSVLQGLSWEQSEDIKKDIDRMGVTIREGYWSILHSLKTLGLRESDIVFIDTTADASKENLEFHKEVIRRGGVIVTANKNPIALSSVEEFRYLTRDRRKYAYRASVMAGGPAVNEIAGAYDTKNTVHSIEGCFSGTLAYICTELEKSKKFSEIVKDAHSRKYTEPNPWDDLSGFDVAKKILILARTAGYDISIEDIEIVPFISQEYASYSGKTFFENIAHLDLDFSHRITRLKSEGKTLRYIASMKTKNQKASIHVGPQEVSLESPLGSLTGTDNKVVIETDCFTSECARPGAGIENTANSIRVDLASLLKERIV
ncbi:MAG: hypothetical protein HHAS10_01020 [Candidatus Altimarinota bacterium]